MTIINNLFLNKEIIINENLINKKSIISEQFLECQLELPTDCGDYKAFLFMDERLIISFLRSLPYKGLLNYRVGFDSLSNYLNDYYHENYADVIEFGFLKEEDLIKIKYLFNNPDVRIYGKFYNNNFQSMNQDSYTYLFINNKCKSVCSVDLISYDLIQKPISDNSAKVIANNIEIYKQNLKDNSDIIDNPNIKDIQRNHPDFINVKNGKNYQIMNSFYNVKLYKNANITTNDININKLKSLNNIEKKIIILNNKKLLFNNCI